MGATYKENAIHAVDYINKLEYELSGIAATLGIIGQFAERGDFEIEGDEIMSQSTHLFRIRREMKQIVEAFEESLQNADGRTDSAEVS